MNFTFVNWIANNPRRATVGGVGVGLLVLAATLVVWGIRVSDRANRLADDLRASGSSAETAFTEVDPETIQDLSGSLRLLRQSTDDLDGDLWPLRWSGAVVGWVPVLGDNVTAAPDLVDRIDNDLVAATALVDAASVFVTAYGGLLDVDGGLIEMLNALPTEGEVVVSVQLINEAELALTKAENTAAQMSEAKILDRLMRKSEELSVQEARLREIIEWAGLAAETLAAMAKLGEVSLPLLGLLDSDGSAGAVLGREGLAAMPDLERVAREAHLEIASTNANTPPGIDGSTIGNVLADFEPILGALAEVSAAGTLTSTAVSPALDEMRSSEGGLIGEGTSILTALGLLKLGRPDFQQSRIILDSIAPGLRSVEFKSGSGKAMARTLSDASDELGRVVGFLADFPEIGTSALGTDGPRRYLALGQTSDELRGSGGFVSGAWIFTFDEGRMSDIEYHDIVEVDDINKLDSYPLPPDLLAQHMDAPVWLLRDTMWSPEFPAAARTAAEIFQLGQGGTEVDGVIALTEWAIVGLGEALGTIHTADGEITSEELLPLIEEGTDAAGRAYVDTLFRSVLDELQSPAVNDRLFGLARAASEMLGKKDALVYMSDPELQEVIARSGWDGSLGRPEGDRIAVIDANVGWNKVDRNIRRSFEYHVSLKPSETMDGRITLSYRNVSAPGRACDIQAPLHGLSYAELKASCYWNLLRIYVPDGTSLVSNDPLPIPATSVFARAASGLPGQDSVNTGVDPGGKFISGLITVPPGETASVGFNLSIPADVLIEDDGTLTYRLSLPAQPGARGRDALINLELPPGYRYLRSSHGPASAGETDITFSLRLEFDTTLEVVMKRTGASAATGSPGFEVASLQ